MLKGISDREMAARAARQSLCLLPLSPFYAGNAPQQGFILGIGSTSVHFQLFISRRNQASNPSLRSPPERARYMRSEIALTMGPGRFDRYGNSLRKAKCRYFGIL